VLVEHCSSSVLSEDIGIIVVTRDMSNFKHFQNHFQLSLNFQPCQTF
jgi:hypothetical protein